MDLRSLKKFKKCIADHIPSEWSIEMIDDPYHNGCGLLVCRNGMKRYEMKLNPDVLTESYDITEDRIKTMGYAIRDSDIINPTKADLDNVNYLKTLYSREIKPNQRGQLPNNIYIDASGYPKEMVQEISYNDEWKAKIEIYPTTQFKKDADPPKNKQKEKVSPEPKPEYGEAVKIRKKKSRWDRLIDRIIENIVWGK